VDSLRGHILAELKEHAKDIEIRESKPDKTDHESLLVMYAKASAIYQFAKRLGYTAGLKYNPETKSCRVWCTKIL
jgi:hypothetical protein